MIWFMAPITALDALRLARLIAPSWREERGCVIRADVYEPENFEQWRTATEGTPSRVEAGLNHLHLWDMLPDTDETDYGELWDLGDVIAHSWSATLAFTFPGREFSVTLTDDYGPTVSVTTTRPAAP